MVKRLTRTIPPLRGPNPQGLNVPLKQVKIVNMDKKAAGLSDNFKKNTAPKSFIKNAIKGS